MRHSLSHAKTERSAGLAKRKRLAKHIRQLFFLSARVCFGYCGHFLATLSISIKITKQAPEAFSGHINT
jgi:hypothetical protein